MTDAPRVLVAHESEVLRAAAVHVLAEAGYDARSVGAGQAVLAALHDVAPPNALVIDVALSDLAAFEICEEARRRGTGVRIILVASVYSRTSYKRRPTSLYGADDYVEQHHVQDMLVAKLEALGCRAPRPPVEQQVQPALEAALRADGDRRLSWQTSSDGGDDPNKRAQRLAWVLLADIVLYNGEQVEAGLRTGDLEQRLARDLDEGRSILALKLPESVRSGRDLLGDALKLYERYRREGGHAGTWPTQPPASIPSEPGAPEGKNERKPERKNDRKDVDQP
jgi:DNA-binding response OmpR family regulator